MADQLVAQNETIFDSKSSMTPNLSQQGGGGSTTEGGGVSAANGGGGIPVPDSSPSPGDSPPTTNGPNKFPAEQNQNNSRKASTSTPVPKEPSQKDGIGYVQDYVSPSTDQLNSLPGPNELFFGGAGCPSGLSYKDREEKVRQLRERQQLERHQKLEELKEQAAAAQRFREQQETVRRHRLDEMRSKDSERRTQVEERKRIIQQAEQERREAVLRKSAEREQRLEMKRRQERSNVVFAFGSSTPRMLDPKENIQNYFGARRATSTTNVNISDSNSSIRRSSECQETDLSRKRATSAHSLNRKPDGEEPSIRPHAPPPPTAARRRTDLLPAFPSLRDSTTSSRGSPRHRSPGRALSLGRLDQLARPRPQRPPSLAPLHESPSSRGEKRMAPAHTMSKSMSHLGPQCARTLIGPATDGAGVPVADGSLDRRSSRSSLALAHPRMTRAETLRLSKLRGTDNAQGVRSGTVTPGSPSRPTSALSQSSGGSQLVFRNRTSPKKPRPLSIAGSTLSSADKPRESIAAVSAASSSSVATPASPASPNRESRSIDRKSSNGSVTSKPLRAKSAGSDRSAPATPAKTSRGTTPKRTPAQVKAESAAKKASERSKPTPKLRSTPKTTPLQSPSVELKPLPGSEMEVDSNVLVSDEVEQNDPKSLKLADEPEPSIDLEPMSNPEVEPQVDVLGLDVPKSEEIKEESKPEPEDKVDDEDVKDLSCDITSEQQQTAEMDDDKSQTQAQRTAEKPVTGYASEEDYKAALAERRRQAREAKEREIELEKQRKMDEEDRERREEEEYLKLMEEQKKAEEERLKKAILEAERQREEENLKKEEEEKQRIEAEKIEQQKRLEAEEKMRKEEEERQMRKNRVAAIMSRTRGKGSTPSKAEAKTPSDETNLNDSLMSSSMTENLINNLSSSMTDSMIVQAIESHQSQKAFSPPREKLEGAKSVDSVIQSTPVPSSLPLSDLSSQILPESPSQAESRVESSSYTSTDAHLVSQVAFGKSASADTNASQPVGEQGSSSNIEELSGVASINLMETQVNGNVPVPMETTPTALPVDLLSSFNGVNGISHNGIDSGSFQPTERHDNQLGSLEPFTTTQTILTEIQSESTTFDQIIDLNQIKLTNEDAVNSNPSPPIIAFEDNLNKKSQQTQEASSNVPDLLL